MSGISTCRAYFSKCNQTKQLRYAGFLRSDEEQLLTLVDYFRIAGCVRGLMGMAKANMEATTETVARK